MRNNSGIQPFKNPLWAIGAVLVAASFVFLASQGNAQEKKVEKVPIMQTNPASGSEMYAMYCAVCHGSRGKGDGPAASQFKTPPTDLTLLAKRNNGKYPAESVHNTLTFGKSTPAHGNIDMPIWNTLFSSIDKADGTTETRVNNLVKYVERMQAK